MGTAGLACALVLLVLGAALQASFIVADHAEKYRLAVALKAAASLSFVVLGALGAASTLRVGGGQAARDGWLVVVGLSLGAAGDVLHALRFVPEVSQRVPHLFSSGALAFLVGHLLYLVYLVPRLDASLVPVAVGSGAAVGAAVLVALSRRVELAGVREVAGGLYLVVLAQVLSFSCVESFVSPGPARISFAAGAASFLVSDTLLACNTFGRRRSAGMRAWSLGTYYAAQALIALSLAL